MFPYEAVPDGNVFAPHHYIYLLVAALLVYAVLWDNYDCREPVIAAGSTLAGLFGFLFVWPLYPAAGAILSLAGPSISVLVILLGWSGFAVGDVWDDYPRRHRVVAILLTLGGLDDVANHAFGVHTPLDYVWNAGLYQYSAGLVVFSVVVFLFYLLAVNLAG